MVAKVVDCRNDNNKLSNWYMHIAPLNKWINKIIWYTNYSIAALLVIQARSTTPKRCLKNFICTVCQKIHAMETKYDRTVQKYANYTWEKSIPSDTYHMHGLSTRYWE